MWLLISMSNAGMLLKREKVCVRERCHFMLCCNNLCNHSWHVIACQCKGFVESLYNLLITTFVHSFPAVFAGTQHHEVFRGHVVISAHKSYSFHISLPYPVCFYNWTGSWLGVGLVWTCHSCCCGWALWKRQAWRSLCMQVLNWIIGWLKCKLDAVMRYCNWNTYCMFKKNFKENAIEMVEAYSQRFARLFENN